GAPTWSRTIADLTAHILAQAPRDRDEAGDWWRDRTGIYHLSGGGETSWAGFAEAIFAAANLACRVDAIPGTDYPTPAKRPMNSRMSNQKLLDTFGIAAPHWHVALKQHLESEG
ncbi:MAG: sugar nucleotide-binding protein, partial [Janthinobacterium lividum]